MGEATTPFDLDRLRAWLDERGVGRGPLTEVRALTGGTQNVLVAFRRDGRGLVLRMPPPTSGEVGAATMRREARVLAALRDTEIPHPRLVAAEDDAAVLGRAFYVMEEVTGRMVTSGLPASGRADYARGIGPAVARVLASLGSLDIAAVGLKDFGRPDGFLARQVPRWVRQLEGYLAMDGYPGFDLPHVDELPAWLEANRPPAQPAGVLHGDVHLGNLLFRAEQPEVAALVDWELATTGDPLLDLAQFLVTWPGPEGISCIGPVAGIPGGGPLSSEEDIVGAYRERSVRDLGALDWYKVLACFRLGSILEGSRARACAGLGPASVGEELHAAARALFEQGHRIATGAR